MSGHGNGSRMSRSQALRRVGLSYFLALAAGYATLVLAPIGDPLEVNGASGDVFLIHPWLFHTRSMNHSGKPRIMSNTEASLKEPMCFERHNGDHSILETSIIRALAEEPRTPPGAFRAGYRNL